MASKRNAGDLRIKLAACEPCREAKVACDHTRPVCSRCQNRSLMGQCMYRERPFKKRKNNPTPTTSGTPADSTSHDHQAFIQTAAPSSSIAMVNQPNPGFLGSSSYRTIFSRIEPDGAPQEFLDDSGTKVMTSLQAEHNVTGRASEHIISNGTRLLEDVKNSMIFPAWTELMDQWLSRRFNVALAGCFSQSCVEATHSLLLRLKTESLIEVSKNLSLASGIPLNDQAEIESYSASFCGEHTRWETLSLCFLLLARATMDIHMYNTFGKDEHERQRFRRKVLGFSDQCLEMALSLDCLNDLQLFVQYENFIAHASIDGDQSYASWRKLGDVTSSLYALGYHEDVIGRPSARTWLQEIRKSAVARAYSADKNLAIFLGRPPRINRKFFSIKVLGQISQDLPTADISKELWILPVRNASAFSYEIDTWWSAMCARLKEEALDLSRESDQEEKSRKASNIEAHALAQWEALPAKYRLNGNLKTHSSDLQERDFVASAKLNHLHVLFIVKIAVARFVPEMSHQLVSISATMLSIVSEAIMLKFQLQNSGTTLMWKLSYYGLPAAGMLCLYLLDSASNYDDVSRTNALRDLNVLVAHISSGAFIDIEDPNFSLLNSAAKAMQAIIEKLFSRGFHSPTIDRERNIQDTDALDDSQWLAWNNAGFQDFETDFWLNIADHPALC